MKKIKKAGEKGLFVCPNFFLQKRDREFQCIDDLSGGDRNSGKSGLRLKARASDGPDWFVVSSGSRPRDPSDFHGDPDSAGSGGVAPA